MTAVLYIEGGGDNRRLGAQFREAWKAFLAKAGLGGRMPRVVRGGTRQQTFNRFTTALDDSKGGAVPILLAQIDPGLVEDACRHAKSLLARLRGFR